jgi:hypothetical protein
MKKNSSNSFGYLCLIFFILLTSIVSIYYFVGMPKNEIFFLTNFFILFISLIGMFYNSYRYYSLVKIFFIFNFIFFGFIPLYNEVNQNTIQGVPLNIHDKIIVNIYILLGIFYFIVGTFIKLNFFDNFINRLPDVKKLNIFFFITFFLISIVILNKWNFDFDLLLFRGLKYNNLETERIFSSTIDIILYQITLRPIPIILLFIFYYNYQKNKIYYSQEKKVFNFFIFLCLSIICILLVSPTAIARFQVASLYIPFFIVFTKIWERPYVMQLSIMFGLFIIMPFLDKFRRFDLNNFSFSIEFHFLKNSTFDAYQNFVRAVELDFVTYGKQLMGAILFFMPRQIWIEKPKGSATTLINDFNLNYTNQNISMPLMAEGYINFGLVGIVFFMILSGSLLSNLDRVAWKIKKIKKNSLFLYYYYFLFGLTFFLMRGELISSLSFLIIFTVIFWIIVYTFKLLGRLNFKI